MRSILLLLPFTLATACTATAIDANNPLTLLVGPDGGSVESDGLKIDVPAGALSSEVTLTAYPKTRTIDGVTTASETWRFGPDGQAFNTPITVSFAYEGQHDNATVWWTKEGDLTTFTNLKTTKADGWAAANIVHFSEGAVGDDTCGSGSDSTDEEDADNEEEDGDEGDDTDDVECEDGVAPDGSACEDGDDEDADSEEEDGSDESDGVDCEDGIDAATGEECDGGPSANEDDGEENDGEEADSEEEHGSCERDESEANDHEDEGDDEGDEGDEGDDTDDVEE